MPYNEKRKRSKGQAEPRNLRKLHSAVKRLMKEAQELREPTEQYACHPLEDNLFEWHFTIRGPADSEFDGGFYHGRIVLPPEYPMKPPSIIILTPNGRFEVNKKICLSISGHHPESWQPSWSLRTAMLAIIGFMPTHGAGALGSLDYTPEERKVLARRSQNFTCPTCGRIDNILKAVTEESEKTKQEARELASQIDFKDEKEKKAALQEASSSQDATEGSETTTTTEETEGATASPPQQTSPLPPPPFGQPPFPFQSPFMPGFPPGMAQAGGGNPAAQVPRFPLPFVGPMNAMMPPFFPPVMNQANFPMPPMMPGMGVPPWQQQNVQAPPASPSTAETNTNSGETTPNTQTGSPPASGAVNSDSVGSGVQSAQSGADTQAASDRSEPVSSTDGLRQRNVPAQQRTSQPSTDQTPSQPTVTQSRIREPESPAFIAFAAVIICLIALLLFRRIYSMKYFTLLF